MEHRAVIADAIGRDIRVALAVESSRRGAALLALRGTGHLGDVAEGRAPPTQTIHADPRRSDRYQAARARREALYQAVLG